MPRPSRNTDQLLIQAARDLLPETGFSGLKLRKVAERAGVNLGMFNYHFKNKQEFVRRVMQETYEEFYNNFTLQVSDESEPPEVQLRKVILTMVRFLRENRQMIISLARDAMDGDQELVRFMEKNLHRHINILLALFRKCKKAGVIGDWPISVALALVGGGIIAPNLAVGVIERIRFNTPYELLKKIMISKVLSDKTVEARLDLIFFALSGGRGKLPAADRDDVEAEWRRSLQASNQARRKRAERKPKP